MRSRDLLAGVPIKPGRNAFVRATTPHTHITFYLLDIHQVKVTCGRVQALFLWEMALEHRSRHANRLPSHGKYWWERGRHAFRQSRPFNMHASSPAGRHHRPIFPRCVPVAGMLQRGVDRGLGNGPSMLQKTLFDRSSLVAGRLRTGHPCRENRIAQQLASGPNGSKGKMEYLNHSTVAAAAYVTYVAHLNAPVLARPAWPHIPASPVAHRIPLFGSIA
jgi:hypothetical protein